MKDQTQVTRAAGWLGPAVYAAVLLLLSGPHLFALAVYAAQSDLNSHILLIPFVSAYLLYLRRDRLPRESVPAPGLAAIPLATGLVALVGAAWSRTDGGVGLSYNDYLSVEAIAFVCFLVAGGFLFLGKKWMQCAAFPVSFLIFLAPCPDGVVERLESISVLASADAANLFFVATGTPVLRDGVVFQLPGIAIRVAQECSGIHSSLVLFITGLLAANLFLKSPWRRAVLVAAVIPLGILRNGFRILVIAQLCIRVGPQMIDSMIHRQGGPLFFAFSLVPMFALLWLLRISGDRGSNTRTETPVLASERRRTALAEPSLQCSRKI